MKPHEEEWAIDEEYRREHGEVLVCDADGFVVATVESQSHEECAAGQHDARGALIAAAPDMARALLAVVKNDDDGFIVSVDSLEAVRAAIRKAGVL